MPINFKIRFWDTKQKKNPKNKIYKKLFPFKKTIKITVNKKINKWLIL